MKKLARAGFTLIEVLVVLGVMAIVSSSIISYNSSSRQQVALATETSKLTQLILRAKSLSISTYGAVASVCGYGIELDYANNYYYLSSYELGPSCDTPNVVSSRNRLETFRVTNGVNLSNIVPGNQVADIIYLPPDPIIYTTGLSDNTVVNQGGSVKLVTANGMADKIISINSLGQVTF